MKQHSPQVNAKSSLALVVEDDLLIQRISKHLLQELGYTVILANNGEEAIQSCKRHDFLFVLMDVHMPVMGGIEAAQHIRNECGQELPIIAFTTDTSEEVVSACLKAGMNTVSKKPLGIEQLKTLIQSYATQPLPI